MNVGKTTTRPNTYRNMIKIMDAPPFSKLGHRENRNPITFHNTLDFAVPKRPLLLPFLA